MLFKETESVELKSVFNETIEKEIVAFLNTHDGSIYIGISDDGSIIGVNDIENTMRDIADIITTKILPNPQEFISTKAIFEQNKMVIVIEVKKGTSLYYIKRYGRSATGCYVRIGTSCRSMTEKQIEKGYTKSISQNDFLLKNPSHIQKLTFLTFKLYLSDKKMNYTDDNINQNYNLLDDNGKYNILAFLLSDQFNISVKISRFDGNNKQGDFLYRKEFSGKSLIKIIDDIPDYIENNINTVRSYFDSGVSRRDVFLLDKNSIREAWVNACIHNDWSTNLGPSVFVYNDHIEFFSFGNPLDKQSKKDFLRGISKPINPSLSNVLLKLGKVEESGKGINTIVRNYGESVFKFSDDYLQVELPYNIEAMNGDKINVTRVLEEKTPTSNQETNSSHSIEIVLNKTHKKIIKLLMSDSSLTTNNLANLLNLSVSTIVKSIRYLRDNNVIYRVGSDKTGTWHVNLDIISK